MLSHKRACTGFQTKIQYFLALFSLSMLMKYSHQPGSTLNCRTSKKQNQTMVSSLTEKKLSSSAPSQLFGILLLSYAVSTTIYLHNSKPGQHLTSTLKIINLLPQGSTERTWDFATALQTSVSLKPPYHALIKQSSCKMPHYEDWH